MLPSFLRRLVGGTRSSPEAERERARLVAADGMQDVLARANELLAWGRKREAAALLLPLAGDLPAESRGALGLALLAADRDAESEPLLADAASRGERDAVGGLVDCLRRRGRHGEALAVCDDALRLGTQLEGLQVMRGEALLALGRGEDAMTCLGDALARDSGDARAWFAQARVLRWHGRYDEALAALRTVQRIGDPRIPFVATIDLALVLQAVGALDEGIELLRSALRTDPSIEGYRTYAQLLLSAGRLREAWDFYEFRWMLEPLVSTRAKLRSAAWSGQDLADRTIMVRVEQGLGDVVQFMRYARLLQQLGAHVEIGNFADIAGSFAGVERVRANGESGVPCAYHVNVLSLPRLFGTTLATIPADVPYLAVDEAKAASWRERLAVPARLRVGLVWAGGAGHPADRQRSLQLRQLAPLLAVADVRFFALQKGPPAAQSGEPGLAERIVSLEHELAGFTDTAAAIVALDLVISVDTSVAHLAGALGKPVWLLVAEPADWRWMRAREDTPWYPTMRLFRQRAPGAWDDVVDRVRVALEEPVQAVETPLGASVRAGNALPRPRKPEEWLAEHPRGYAAVAETACGILQYLPDILPMGPSLACYGEYLGAHLDLLGTLIEAGDTILEMDSGVGAHALDVARRIGPQGHLLAVEKNPLRRRILGQNVAVNRCGNVTVVQPPAGQQTPGGGAAIAVDALRLDYLDWLKLGTEDDGEFAISGLEATLWRLRPRVFATCVRWGAATGLARHLRDFGYRCWGVESPLFREANFAGGTDDIFDNATTFALFAIPEERANAFSMRDAVEIE
jgi:tetratricopeptide (TPR) repeat protein